MDVTELTIEILKSIRDEVKETNGRLDQTNAQLESMQAELSRRIVESETRTATAITDLAGTVRDMTAVLRAGDPRDSSAPRSELRTGPGVANHPTSASLLRPSPAR
jgi:hypothetical protein